MTFKMLRALVAVSALLTIPATISAKGQQGGGNRGGDDDGDRGRAPWSVPEFDPAAIGAVAALVAGGGVLLARLRKRN